MFRIYQVWFPEESGKHLGFPTNNPTIGIGEFTQDQLQSFDLEFLNGGSSTGQQLSGPAYGINGSTLVDASGPRYYRLDGSSEKFSRITSDGTHGTPRVGYETRGKSLGVYFLIKT